MVDFWSADFSTRRTLTRGGATTLSEEDQTRGIREVLGRIRSAPEERQSQHWSDTIRLNTRVSEDLPSNVVTLAGIPHCTRMGVKDGWYKDISNSHWCSANQ